ncbi:unnamed protein product [Pseudo-nitzschia multistriata]|uniref:3'-5' exonuclease domain-containing protein n=1 Tax=Pseudo-nitzschia multistriata TaxID=183589 RepID=A0A448Z600_9STRA|nr:unnamed protein product [Pseudo-nitzschia multistriata]
MSTSPSSSSSTAVDQAKGTSMFSPSKISVEPSKLMLEVISSCDDIDTKKALSKETLTETYCVLRRFIIHQSKTNTTTTEDTQNTDIADVDRLRPIISSYALIAAEHMCQIANDQGNEQEKMSRKNKKRTWEALQNAAGTLQNSIHQNTETKASELPMASNALAVSMVFGALSLLQQQQSLHNSGDNGSAKAAASALSSTVSRNTALRLAGQPLSALVLRSCVSRAYCDKQESFRFDLTILNHLAKSFHLTNDFVEPRVIAKIVRKAVPKAQATYEREDLVKQSTAGAFALSCQLRPWSILSPIELMDAATAYDFYHSAEEICRSAHGAANDAGASSLAASVEGDDDDDANGGGNLPFSALEQNENVRSAVEKLIDTAMASRMYRRADALATSLYGMGGRSRFVKARYFHARDTIAKVVARRQFPIVDRQIERVDKAVAKIGRCNETEEKSPDGDPASPGADIRRYAIEMLEEAGEITAAQRLASLHGMEYVYDEEAILLAAKARREKYLQYDDLLPGEIPPLITETHELRSGFDRLVRAEEKASSSSSCNNHQRRKRMGFDAEWDEETKGVALLQLSGAETVLLIDVPALSSTEDGVNALRETVGKVLDSSDWAVIGFACRQDLSRLRATPCVPVGGNPHWISGAGSVVDVQPLVWDAEPALKTTGLSRACEHYLGKPLDKSEQCSLWSSRPLSDRQRSYAALDAWVCVAIYAKVSNPDSEN